MPAEGRTRRRLREILEALGFQVEALRPALGYWRSDHRADVLRWEGVGRVRDWPGLPVGMSVQFGSWNTMTDCVRNGVDVEREEGTFFDVSAKTRNASS